MKSAFAIRPIVAKDRVAFLSMWRDFVALAPDEPGNHAMGELNWERIMDGDGGLRALVACAEDGEAVGFTLYLASPSPGAGAMPATCRTSMCGPTSAAKGWPRR